MIEIIFGFVVGYFYVDIEKFIQNLIKEVRQLRSDKNNQ